MATFLGYKIKIDEEDNWEDYYVDDRYQKIFQKET